MHISKKLHVEVKQNHYINLSHILLLLPFIGIFNTKLNKNIILYLTKLLYGTTFRECYDGIIMYEVRRYMYLPHMHRHMHTV